MRKKSKLIRKASKFKPYDYGFMLELELEMLKQMVNYFDNSDITDCDKEIAKECRLAYNLLNIFLNPNVFRYENSFKTIKLLKYVNTKNAKRFKNDFELKEDTLWNYIMLEELYEQKAWHLYNNLRKERMQKWWN